MDAKLTGALVAACLLVAPAHLGAETRPRPSKSALKGSLLSRPTTVDPVQARSHAETTLVSLLFDTLYRLNLEGDPVPHLALALPEVQGKTARIRLYPGVLFHNNTELTADDVVQSLERLAESKSGWLLEPVKSVRRDGDDVVLELRRDTPELAKLLAAPQTAVTWQGKKPTLRRPIGSGPFRMGGVGKDSVTLVQFEKHFFGPPFVRGLTLKWFAKPDAEAKAYEAGERHLSLRGEVAFAGHKPKYQTTDVEGPAVILSYVGFGTNRKVLSKTAFREAVSLAVSRDALRNVGSGEKVVPTIYPAAVVLGGPATSNSRRKADRVEAKRKLAGLTVGSTPLEVLVDRTRLDDAHVGEKLVASLIRVGVDAKLAEVSAATFAKRVASGKCDLYIGQMAPVAADSSLQFVAAFEAGGDSWARKKLRRAALNPISIVGQFETRLPIVPLFHRAVRVHHRANVRGAELDVLSRLSYADLRVNGSPKKSKP